MVTINMQDQVKMLIELQMLDSEIFDKKKILDSVPEKIKGLDDILEQKSAALKSYEDESKGLQVKRKEKEVELESKEQSIKKYQAQLYQIKTNKEYTSLEKEIAGIRADNSVLEDDIITLLDKIEEIQKKITEEKKVLEEEKKRNDTEKKKIEEEKKKIEAEYNDLTGKRKEFVEKIDKSLLSKYDRILQNKDGLAMVPIVNDSCGGCNMNLPPQVINEAKMKKTLMFCGNCARILYTEE